MNKATNYINELNELDEHVKIEAKQCTNKIDRSVLETICAFSNEPDLDGGTILIGVSETFDSAKPYEVTGVEDSDKLQKDLSSQCASMFNHPVRPIVTVESIEGKRVIVVEVPELDFKNKPLFFKNEGLPRGAWRRIGSTDQRCTEEDLHVFYTEADNFDTAIAEDTDLEDLDENAVRIYRELRAKVDPDAEELKLPDIEMLRSLKAVKKAKDGSWKLTNTGLLVFGKQMSLRREMPAVRVDYIRVTGTKWVEDPYNRFQSIDMRGPLLLMVNRAFNAVADDLPRGFSIPAGSLQARRPLSIPEDALREAIVNALVHQSLRVHRPIQIIRYSNRIEIINPGFSLKPAETLGEPGSEMRNPTIGSIFHETKLAEAKGTGISTMRRLMKEAGMMPPTFDSDCGRNTFTTRILLHHFMPEEDVRWLASNRLLAELNDAQKTAIIFLREVGAIDNITYRQLSGVSAREASASLKRLENLGLLKMNGQGRNTYYTPSTTLLEMYEANAATSTPNNATSEDNARTLGANAVTPGANAVTSPSNAVTSVGNAVTAPEELDRQMLLSNLPNDIKERIYNLKARNPKTIIEALIVDICAYSPHSAYELVTIFQMDAAHIKTRYIAQLLKEGRICFTIPEMRNHPNQKYTAGNHE